jgi:hypothetical protein
MGKAGSNPSNPPALTIAAPVARALRLTGAMDWRRGHEIINAYALALLHRHLKEDPQQLLSGRSERFPEVGVWSRNELR